MYKSQAIIFSLKALINCLKLDMFNINYFMKMRAQKEVLTSIGIQLSFGPRFEQAKGLLYPYKQLKNSIDNEMGLVELGAIEILYSFLLVNNADYKRYGDL